MDTTNQKFDPKILTLYHCSFLGGS